MDNNYLQSYLQSSILAFVLQLAFHCLSYAQTTTIPTNRMDDDFSILLRRCGLNMDQVRSTMSAMFPPKQKPIAVYRPHMVSTPQPTLRLPVDVIGVVAECLSGSYSYGTLAALNRTCKLVRAQTLPILFETVVWDNEYDGPQREWWWEPLQGRNGTVFEFPEG